MCSPYELKKQRYWDFYSFGVQNREHGGEAMYLSSLAEHQSKLLGTFYKATTNH